VTEPIPVKVTRYLCPYCRRGHSAKARARDHIQRCWDNPGARGCKTCDHFEPYEMDCWRSGSGEHPERCRLGIELPASERGGTTLALGCPSWEAVTDGD
jgi:hypothetical protein